MSRKLAKGFKCTCGEYHTYKGYVYAHRDSRLIFTCPECKRKYSIFQGAAKQIDKE